MDGTKSIVMTCPDCRYEWLYSIGDDGSCPNCGAEYHED